MPLAAAPLFAFLVLVIALAGCGGETPDFTSCVSSPHGDVSPPDSRFYSADRRYYARQLERFNTGRIDVFNRETDEPVARIQLNESGPLKGACMAPDGSWVTLIYHHDHIPNQKGYVSVVSTRSAEELQRIPIPAYYHYFNVSEDGKAIIADGHRLPIGPFENRSTAGLPGDEPTGQDRP